MDPQHLLETVIGGFVVVLLSLTLRKLASEPWRKRTRYRLRMWWRGRPKPLPVSWGDLADAQLAAGRPGRTKGVKELGISGLCVRVKGRVLETKRYYRRRSLALEMNTEGVALRFHCIFHPYGYPDEAFDSLDAYFVEVDGTIERIEAWEMGTPIRLSDCRLIKRSLAGDSDAP